MRKQTGIVAIITLSVYLVFMAGCSSPSKPTSPAVSEGRSPAVSKAVTPSSEQARTNDAGLLAVDKLEYDFGDVDPGSRNEGNFLLKNEGKGTLEIDEVRSTCGCTVPKLKTKVLKPGETTPLKFTYHAGTTPGKTSKHLKVTTKAPSLPELLQLTLTATIARFIETDPERLRIELNPAGDDTFLVRIMSTDGESFQITGFQSTSSAITADYDPSANAAEYSLTVRVDRDKIEKFKHGTITLQLTHPKLKKLLLPFETISPFIAKPNARYFRDLSAGQPSRATILIASNFNEVFELGEITSENGFVRVVNTTKQADGYEIEIELTPPANAKQVKDHLIVPIKDRPGDTLKILCYGVVQ